MNYPRLLRWLRVPAALLVIAAWTSNAMAQGTVEDERTRAKIEQVGEIGDEQLLARSTSALDRAVAPMGVGKLDINTYNFGLLMGRIFSSGVGNFPAPGGQNDRFYWVSSIALGVGPGPSVPNAMVHEASDFKNLGQVDWEVVDGARGGLYANPPQFYFGYPMYALSDVPASWPSSGWPAPTSVQETWVGTEMWNPWDHKGDRESYSVFDDSYAARDGTNESHVLGIEVKKRAIAYGALNLIFFQYELENTSAHTYTDVFVGQIVDAGTPRYNDYAGYLNYDESRQLIYSTGSNYDPVAGTHTNDDSPPRVVSWVGHQFLESPTGHFRKDPSGAYVDDPTQTLTRVALLDWSDRVQSSEMSLYGAISGDISYMGPSEASAVWKSTTQAGVVLKQTAADHQAYNPGWASSMDNFFYVSSGPVTFGPGEKLDYVVAVVAGFTEQEMIAEADQAIKVYNLQFAGPSSPPPPADFKSEGVLAGPSGVNYDDRIHRYPIYYAGSGGITITWDGRTTESTPDPVSGNVDFQGYRIYRSSDRGNTWGEVITDGQGNRVGWTPVANFDVNDGINGPDKLSDLYFGDDTGIVHTWTDNSVMDGIEYWYAITSYDSGEYDVAGNQTLRLLETPIGSDPSFPTVIAVQAGARPNGYQDGGLVGATATESSIELYSPADPDKETTIAVNLIDGASITGDDYGINIMPWFVNGVGDTVTHFGGVQVRNNTAAMDLFEAPAAGSDPAKGNDNIPVTEGFRVFTAQPNGGDAGIYSFTQTADADPDTAYVPGDAWVGPEAYMEAAGSTSNRGNVNGYYPDLEVRFVGFEPTPGDTTWGYDLFTRTDIPVPFELWDATNGTRLYPVIYDYGALWSGYTNPGEWDGWDIVVFTMAPYFQSDGVTKTDFGALHPNSDGAYWGYVPSDPYSRYDWVYRFAFTEDDRTHELWDAGDVYTLETYKPLKAYAGNSYTFSTTASAVADTAVSLDEIRVVPNPYYIFAEWDQNENNRMIQFRNVPPNSTVDIYTLSGELIASLAHDDSYNSDKIGTVEWNIWTYEFTEAAYGLYIYVVKTSNGDKKVGKFAVIR